MARRAKMRRGASRKAFSRTAHRTHPKNSMQMGSAGRRGGVRL